jgi:hypothetical protein
MEGFMKYAVDMGSVAMMYEVHTKFHNDWFRHLNVDSGDTQTGWRSHKPTL